eukprot:TRINITY_DN9954_c0_g1_i2.p1 TRINITY_DN9954_c0_g1~~TRINITY_DN9954_c0_g1_i2.p1  ORF type:complete len:335 (+),score=83.61 TRINITY_DN9954_c0_g1_i2:52-1056(+)
MMQPEDDEGGTSEQQPVEVQNRQSTQSATSAHSYSSTRPQSSSSLRNETERGAKFEFDVTNPEVITDKRTQYILYTIFVKVTNPSGKIELYNVQRRYSEFDWIRAKLTESHPGCIVPPLPSKSLFHRTGKKVVDDRLLGLKKFLDLVVSNSNLAEDEDFHKFFKWNRTNFASFLAANKRTTMQDLSSKLEDAMGDILLENVEESNETYEAVKRNLSALSSSLGNLRSISEKMIASHSELSVARSGVVSAITEHSEPSRELKDILLKTSATMQQISVYDSEMEERLKKDLQPFGYYEKMATSVSDAMKARFAHLVRFCDLEKSLESKTQKLEQVL